MNPLPNILQRINWMLGAGILFRGLSAITTLSMTYFLAPADYAVYSFAMSASLLVALVAAAGLPDYIVSQAENGRFYTAELVWQSWLLNFVLGGGCLLILYLSIFSQNITPSGKVAIMLINVATVLASGNVISQAALRSVHLIPTQAKLMLLSISLSTTGLIFTAWRFGNAALIGLATLIVFSIMFVVHTLVLRRQALVRRAKTAVSTLWTLLQKTFPFGVVLILEMAIPVMASYLVLTRYDSELAGSFNLMITLLLSAMMIATALDQTFYPVLVTGKKEARSQTLSGYLLFSLFVALPAFVIFFFHAEAIGNIVIFQKYAFLSRYLSLLAYLVPLHFVAKVCTIVFRLRMHQRPSIFAYLIALVWIIGRSFQPNVMPVDIGRFMIEGQVIILTLLAFRVLPTFVGRAFWPKLGKVLVPTAVSLIISLLFFNNLFVLALTLVIYGVIAWGLHLHQDLLALVQE